MGEADSQQREGGDGETELQGITPGRADADHPNNWVEKAMLAFEGGDPDAAVEVVHEEAESEVRLHTNIMVTKPLTYCYQVITSVSGPRHIWCSISAQ